MLVPFLETLSKPWRDLHRTWLSEAKVAVHHIDALLQQFVVNHLHRHGVSTLMVEDPSDLPEDVSILLTGPGDVTRKPRRADRWVVINRSVSAAESEKAFADGADDVRSLGVDGGSRLATSIVRELSDIATRRLIFSLSRELGELVRHFGVSGDELSGLDYTLSQFKASVHWCPEVAVFGDSSSVSLHAAAMLTNNDIKVEVVASASDLLAGRTKLQRPLVVVLSPSAPTTPRLVELLKSADPMVEVLLLAENNEELAQDTGLDGELVSFSNHFALIARAKRLVKRSRRHRLYHHLIECLAALAETKDVRFSREFVRTSPSRPVRLATNS
jgi:hypothetical protein